MVIIKELESAELKKTIIISLDIVNRIYFTFIDRTNLKTVFNLRKCHLII